MMRGRMRFLFVILSLFSFFIFSAEARCSNQDNRLAIAKIKAAEKERAKSGLSQEERYTKAITKLSQTLAKKDLCPLDEALMRVQRAVYYVSGPNIAIEEALIDLRRVDELDVLRGQHERHAVKAGDIHQHLLFETSQYEEMRALITKQIELTRLGGGEPHSSQFYRLSLVSYFEGKYGEAKEQILAAINAKGFTDELLYLPLAEAIFAKLNDQSEYVGILQRYSERHPEEAFVMETLNALESGQELNPTFSKKDGNILSIRLRISGAIGLNRYPPKYPFTCEGKAKRGERYRVEIRFVVGPDGKTKDPEVVSTPYECFNEYALQSLEQWRYQPALLNGQPTEMEAKTVFVFLLE